MAFSRRQLNANESVVVDLHPRGWNLLPPAACVLASLVVAMASAGDLSAERSRLLILASLLSAGWLLGEYLKWNSTSYVVTNRRIIYSAGVFSRQTNQIPLESVRNVHSYQSPFARLIGYGDVLVEAGGTVEDQRFSQVRSPESVVKAIYWQIEQSHRPQPQTIVKIDDRSDIASQLERLEALLERGSISRSEFETLKNRLFDR